MAIKRKLLIPPESARPREAGWLDECRQRSFAALRACPERSEGMTALPDFGDAICYYRYFRVPEELEPQEPQERSSDVGDLLPGNIAEKLGATPAEAQQRSASYTSKLGEISTDFEVKQRK